MKRRKPALLLVLAAVLTIMLASCSQDPAAKWKSLYNTMYAHLSNRWAQSMEHTDAETAFYGDSRVEGADWYSAYPGSRVINLGVGGDVVSSLITRMNQIKILTESGNLERCFVAIGGNDCLSDFDETTFRMQYEKLLTELKDLGLTVYLNTIAGVKATESYLNESKAKKANERIILANQIILQLADSHGIQVIDMAQLMNNEDGSLKDQYSCPDGVHFSDAGNQIWYDTLRPYVENN